MSDKERKILEEAGLLYPVPNCVEYYQTVQGIAKEVADSIWEAINNKVQVVRCKDCVNWDTSWEPSAKGCHYCGVTDLTTKPDWFCAEGERREDG